MATGFAILHIHNMFVTEMHICFCVAPLRNVEYFSVANHFFMGREIESMIVLRVTYLLPFCTPSEHSYQGHPATPFFSGNPDIPLAVQFQEMVLHQELVRECNEMGNSLLLRHCSCSRKPSPRCCVHLCWQLNSIPEWRNVLWNKDWDLVFYVKWGKSMVLRKSTSTSA